MRINFLSILMAAAFVVAAGAGLSVSAHTLGHLGVQAAEISHSVQDGNFTAAEAGFHRLYEAGSGGAAVESGDAPVRGGYGDRKRLLKRSAVLKWRFGIDSIPIPAPAGKENSGEPESGWPLFVAGFALLGTFLLASDQTMNFGNGTGGDDVKESTGSAKGRGGRPPRKPPQFPDKPKQKPILISPPVVVR